MKIWWSITEKQRNKLARMQRRLFQTELNPPAPEERPPIRTANIETPEEIDHLIRQAPSRSRDKDAES